MVAFRFNHVRLEATGVNLPPSEITSAEIEDRLAPLYKRLHIPFGTLEKLSGISSRYVWDRTTMPSQVGTAAARLAIEKLRFPKEEVRAVLNCSVTRDYFEPATACLIHGNLGLPEDSMALDITNACIGFSNGLMLLANMIETGVVRAGLVVTGETIAPIIDSTIEHLLQTPDISREDLLKLLPTFTIGSGAVAYVLCHESIASSPHRIIGAVSRSASQYCDLCAGNADYEVSSQVGVRPMMVTESAKLMASAAKLGSRMFKDFTEAFGWRREDVNHIVCHQVGRQVNEGFYKEMGLDIEKEFTIYKKYGNMVSAAMPTALALSMEEKQMKAGEKVLLTAFGSGLNSLFIGVEW